MTGSSTPGGSADTASTATMRDEWWDLVAERNARETDPFVDVYESYEGLMHLVDNLQSKCEEQETQLLDHAMTSLHADGLSLDNPEGEGTTAGGGAGSDTASATNSIVNSSYSKNAEKKQQSKRETQLRDKVEKLQEQLNTKLKFENDSTKAQLKQATELSELKDKVVDYEYSITQLKSDNKEANDTIESLLTRLKETESSLHVTTEQNGKLKESIDKIRDENEDLTKVNDDLLGRFVSEKEGMMDQFNKMNSLLEHQQHEIDLLRSLKQQQEDQVSRLENASSPNRDKSKKNLVTLAQEDNAKEAAMMGGFKGLSLGDNSVQPPTSPKHIFQKCHKGEIVSVRYDSQGIGGNIGENDLLATAGTDGVVKVWNSSKGSLVTTLRASGAGQPLLCVDISGELVAAGSSDKSCRIWSLKTGRMIHHLIGHGSKVTCVRLMPDHKSVLSGSGDRSMKLWDISRGTYRQTSTLRHGSTVYCFDLHLDASTVVSGHLDGGLRFWDTRSGGAATDNQTKQTLEIPNLHAGGITSVQFNPNDSIQLLTFGRDASLKLIDIRKMGPDQVVRHLSHPKLTVGSSGTFTASAAISPDGAFCAVGSSGSKLPPTMFVWRLSDGKLLRELKTHISPIQGVAWGRGGVVGGPQVSSIDKGGNLILWS
jgi:autophagy-related protein 16